MKVDSNLIRIKTVIVKLLETLTHNSFIRASIRCHKCSGIYRKSLVNGGYMLSLQERKFIDDLFNRNGYVLTFSTYRFDEFTMNSVGVALREEYGFSKGKSLRRFIEEGEDY